MGLNIRTILLCLSILLGLYCTAVSSDDLSELSSTLMPSLNLGDTSSNSQSSSLWILIMGFIFAFALSFGVGANDVANVFGTSVGAKVLSLRNACILATIFETLGAVLLGYKVSDTVRKGILDVSLYNNTEKELMLGSLAALSGSAMWNIVATFFRLPISGTHTIVGATVGFTLCARGFNGVKWVTFSKIVLSWFVSPVLSGGISVALFLGVRQFVSKRVKPVEAALKALPFFYGFTILINVFSIVHDGPSVLYLDNLPWYISLAVALATGFLVAIVVQCFVVPRQRKTIKQMRNYDSNINFSIEPLENDRELPNNQKVMCDIEKNGVPQIARTSYTLLPADENGYAQVKNSATDTSLTVDKPADAKEPKDIPESNSKILLMKEDCPGTNSGDTSEDEDPAVGKLFSFLQILTATFGSFAHGGNDVSNAIGPLIAIWAIYSEGSVAQKTETPIYILFYGGLGISVGLWIWGRRVIQTIGENLTKVTPSSGFTIEIGSAFTVLMASKIGLPISTTHCKVGSVVFVGWAKSSKNGVDWNLFRNIVLAWVVTVPLTAGLSAALMYIFRTAFL